MINPLYTHVSQSLLPSGQLDLSLGINQVQGRTADRAISLELSKPVDSSVLIEYGDVRIPIDCRTPLSCRSTKKVWDTVEQESYRVLLKASGVFQSRAIKYAPNQGLLDNFRTVEVFSESGDAVSTTIPLLPNRTGYCSLIQNPPLTSTSTPFLPLTIGDAQIFTLIPNVVGLPDFVSDSNSTFIDIGSPLPLNFLYSSGSIQQYDWDLFPPNPTVISKAFFPESSGGYLASSKVGSAMDLKNLTEVSLGLFAACSEGQDDLVISNLKAILNLSKRWGFIKLESKDSYVPVSNPLGFPETFRLEDSAPDLNPTVVLSNALLGLSLARALTYLQDRFPVLTVELYGEDLSFNSGIKAVLLFLSRYCAASISLETGWCSETFIEGEADAVDSIAASHAVAVFLAEALSIQYDEFTHFRFARLQYTVKDSPAELFSNPYYQEFGDPQNQPYLDPDGLLSTASLQLKGLVLAQAFKILWSLQQESKSRILDYFASYETLRNLYLGSLPSSPLEPTLSDYVVAYCYCILKYTLDVQVTIPAWALNASQNPVENSLRSWAFNSLIQANFLIFSLKPFDALEYGAKAVISQDLQELRRMWPFGYGWMSTEAENNSTSALGALLRAQAEVGLDWALSYLMYKQGNDLRQAQGTPLRSLIKTILPETLLCSDDFARQYLLNYQLPRPTSLEDLLDQAALTQGIIPLTLETLSPPPFCRYQGNPFETTGSWYQYEPGQTWDPEDLSSQQYLTLGYRPLFPRVSDAISISEPLSISSTLGLEPRPTAGFPYLHVTLSMNEIDISQPIPLNISPSNTPEADGYVVDGPVLIKPLSKFYPYSIFKTSGSIGNYFIPYLHQKISAGNPYLVFQGFPKDSSLETVLEKL